jgi:RimJ/RimL family protein N-acetyltransferase
MILETDRLILRGWRNEDTLPLLAICQDPAVMRHLGPPQTLPEVQAAIARQEALRARLGYCYWALWHKEDRHLIGFCGLSPGPAGTPIEGAVDIGWRLRADRWGQGYAREAAEASLAWGFARPDIDEIWSITVPANQRSRGLMQRLGMSHAPERDFDHPHVPADSALRRHVAYRIGRPA